MKRIQHRIKVAVSIALMMLVATTSMALAQEGLLTKFTSSITLQNLSSTDTTVTFNFYPEMSGTPVVYEMQLAGNAGASLSLGNPAVGLPGGFSGSATLSANVPLAAVPVQVPQAGSEVQNRPLSVAFTSAQASNEVLLATVLKNQFGVTTQFSVQNADSAAINIQVSIYNAADTAAAPIVVSQNNIPPGASRSFDMSTLSQITAGSFNGSAIISATRSEGGGPGNIVATATELGVSGANRLLAAAFEGVNEGGTTVYMATALCNVFGGATSAYAIQNASQTNAANITVNFVGNLAGSTDPIVATRNVTVAPGAKASVVACNDAAFPVGNPGHLPSNFTGAATVTSNQPIIVIGKVFGSGLGTAFLGETAGTSTLALPYVRFSSDDRYNSGQYQRGNIAIQNVGAATVNNVQVRYLNRVGGVVGTHTIPSIAPGAKANSNALRLCPTPGSSAGCPDSALLFGNPESNPGGGFGGAVQIVGGTGSELIAIVRIESNPPSGRVGEDYNGIPVTD